MRLASGGGLLDVLRLRRLPVTGWSQWQQCYDSLTATFKWKTSRLDNPEVVSAYAEELKCTLDDFLNSLNERSPDESLNIFIEWVRKAAIKTIGRRRVKDATKICWWDEEVKLAVENRNQTQAMYAAAPSRKKWDSYQRARKLLK
jgi:hypothetical protein